MHAVLLLVGVVKIVESPALEVRGLDNQRVTFPVSNGIAVVHGLQSLAMRAAIERDDTGHALEFVDNDEIILVLDKLDGVGREHTRGESSRHAKLARFIMARIAGGRFKERHTAGFERR